MKVASKISIMSFVLTVLYGSSSFAAPPGLIFSSQPIVHTMTVNSSQVLKYTVTNTSNHSIQFSSIDVGPHLDSRYWTTGNDCQGVIAAGQNCHITLSLFAPAEPGFMNTALFINYGQPTSVLRSKPIQFDIIAAPIATAKTSTAIVATNANTAKATTTKTVTTKTATTGKTTTVTKPTAMSANTYHTAPVISQPVIVETSNQNVASSQAYMLPMVTIPSGPSPLESQTPFIPFKDVPHSGVEANLFAGAANLHTDIGDEVFPPVFPVLPPQTNTLHGSSHNVEFSGGGGLGYDLVLPAAASGSNNYFLRDVSLGINAYYVGGHEPSGEVYRFGLPQFNFDNYAIDLNSTRVMVDSELDFHPIGRRFVPFVIGGIGDAVNIMGYSETPIPGSGSPGGEVKLSHHTENNFAYEVGAGIKVLITSNSQFSLRYLYANLGSAEADSSELAQPLTVDNMNTSSILLGYTYIFGN